MNPTEVVQLSKLIKALCPAQKFEEDTPQVWHPLLEHVPLSDALEAVRRCGMRLAFIAPSDILGEVRAIRRERLDRADATFVPTGDPSPEEYIRQLRAHRKTIGDGAPAPVMPALERAVRPSLLERVFRRVPKALEARPQRLAPDPDAMQRARDEIAQLHKQPTSQGDPNR